MGIVVVDGHRNGPITGQLRFLPSRSENGAPILSINIVSGDDKLAMIRAHTSRVENASHLMLMRYWLRGCLLARDDRQTYQIRVRRFVVQADVDSMLYDNDCWCLYGTIVDHDLFGDTGLNLRGLDYCAEYNPSHRLGRMRISLLEHPLDDAA